VDPAGNLYVADAGNNRVLEYDSPQTNPVANQVFGQSNSFNSASGCNAGGISAASLCLNSNISFGIGPPNRGLATDSVGNLYAADTANNRVLVFAAITPTQTPTATPTPNDEVVLQPPLNFGVTVHQTSPPQIATLTNFQTVPLTISSIATSGDFAQTSSCGKSLLAFGKCSINVTFSPTTFGPLAGKLTVVDNGPGSPQSLDLSGTGFSAVTLLPRGLDFGNRQVGAKSAPRSLTLTNTSTAPLAVTIAVGADYSEIDTCTGPGVTVLQTTAPA